MGHELRNPLATVSNTVNSLKNTDMAADPQRVQWGVGMIERQTQRLMHLVDDLLDVVRITRGKVEADPTRLAQVFNNLLANAAWYTEHPGMIDVSVSQSDVHATVRIRDTGIGIPHELLPHIFNIFTQGPEARHKKEKGLGIGLTLVRQLVELHGGHVQVASQGPGKGSEFTVQLPLDGKNS